MSSNSALWRHCKRFHQDIELVISPQRSEQDEPDQNEFVMEHACPCDSDPEETLTDASPMVLQSQTPEQATAETSSRVQDESIRNPVTDSVEKLQLPSRLQAAEERA